MNFAKLLEILKAAEGDEARLTLATVDIWHPALSEDERDSIKGALFAAAIPHWCDNRFLAALLEIPNEKSSSLMQSLLGLNVMEDFEARGEGAVNVSEVGRLALRNHLRIHEPGLWTRYSERARNFVLKSNENYARVEAVYHYFVINQGAAVNECEALNCECMEIGSPKPELRDNLALAMGELTKNDWLTPAAHVEAALSDLAVRSAKDDTQDFEARLKKVLKLAQNAGRQSGIARVSCFLGDFHLQKGEFEKAKTAFEVYESICVRLYAATPNDALRRTSRNIARARVRDLNKALNRFKKALGDSRKMTESSRDFVQGGKASVPGVPTNEEHERMIREKQERDQFDVFLSYNSQDKPMVEEIAEALKKHGILPWLDNWDLRPGDNVIGSLEAQIQKATVAAVFIGSNGLGPWQNEEREALILQVVEKKCVVIPVILDGAVVPGDLPLFLKTKQAVNFNDRERDPLKELIRGIRKKRPASPPTA